MLHSSIAGGPSEGSQFTSSAKHDPSLPGFGDGADPFEHVLLLPDVRDPSDISYARRLSDWKLNSHVQKGPHFNVPRGPSAVLRVQLVKQALSAYMAPSLN